MQYSFVENTVAYIGLVFIMIQIDHITRTEIGKEGISLLRNVKRYLVKASHRASFLSLFDGELHKNVARLNLLAQRHIPQIGTAIAYTLKKSESANPLLTI